MRSPPEPGEPCGRRVCRILLRLSITYYPRGMSFSRPPDPPGAGYRLRHSILLLLDTVLLWPADKPGVRRCCAGRSSTWPTRSCQRRGASRPGRFCKVVGETIAVGHAVTGKQPDSGSLLKRWLVSTGATAPEHPNHNSDYHHDEDDADQPRTHDFLLLGPIP